MKLFKNISENNRRFLILVLAFICLLLNIIAFENNFISKRMTTDDCLWIDTKHKDTAHTKLIITQIIKDGVADQAGLKDGDILIAINGVEFTETLLPMDLLNRYSNEYITYTIVRNGQILDAKIWVYKFISYSFLIFWVIGLAFLFVGTIVGYSKPKESTSKLFFFFSCAASIGLILYSGTSPIGAINPSMLSSWQKITVTTINILFIAGMLLIPPLYVHLFSTFPVKYEFKRRKLFIVLAYVIAITPEVVLLIIGGNNSTLMNVFLTAIPVLYFFAGSRFFRKSLKKVTDPVLKKSLSIISKGFMIGGAGIAYYLLYTKINNQPVFLINPLYLIPTILVIAIPISFGYSIMKYRILDTEFLVKKSLVFGIVTIGIILLYLVLVYFMNSYFKEVFKGNNQLLIITFIIIFTFSFDFVNKRAKAFVDKQFFRENYNYRKSLLEFSKDISYISNTEDLISKIRDFLMNTVGIEAFNLRVINQRYIKSLDLSHKEIDVLLKKILTGNQEAILVNAFNVHEIGLTDTEKAQLKEISLIIPIYLKDELLGALTFGMKHSGKAFSEEDIDLLKSFASQSAISLENTRLNVEQINKQKYEDEVNIAKRIQYSLLPDNNIIHTKMDIAGYSEPAREIGGDFYDIIKLSDDRVLVAIADVSDKGIPAALYMSQVQAMLQFASEIFVSPMEILTEINKQIYDQLNRYSFVTILIAIFDVKNNIVKVARAGHTPLIRVRNGKSENIYTKGIGIGLDRQDIFNNNIEEVTMELKEGDVYFMYSDGVSEAMDEKRELFGSENVERIVKDNSNGTPEMLKTNLLSGLSDFRKTASINDDITFVGIKIMKD
ncbi:MAG: SpoIIE family protein phosphatase [Ignavibacteriae bacterium]|nr:SpoIIE family protein phosphatase [Ignavibacteriota bacterium]